MPTRVLHVSDLHVGRRVSQEAHDALASLVERVQPELVIASGDLSHRGRRDQHDRDRHERRRLHPQPARRPAHQDGLGPEPGHRSAPAEPVATPADGVDDPTAELAPQVVHVGVDGDGVLGLGEDQREQIRAGEHPLRVVGEGVADFATVDRILKDQVGFKLGPFELMDLIGIDTNLAVTKSIYQAFGNDPKFRPSPIQQEKVDLHQLGRKTGKGFYDYSS